MSPHIWRKGSAPPGLGGALPPGSRGAGGLEGTVQGGACEISQQSGCEHRSGAEAVGLQGLGLEPGAAPHMLCDPG